MNPNILEDEPSADLGLIWVSWAVEIQRQEGERLRVIVERVDSKLFLTLLDFDNLFDVGGVAGIDFSALLTWDGENLKADPNNGNVYRALLGALTEEERALICPVSKLLNLRPPKRTTEGLPEL